MMFQSKASFGSVFQWPRVAVWLIDLHRRHRCWVIAKHLNSSIQMHKWNQLGSARLGLSIVWLVVSRSLMNKMWNQKLIRMLIGDSKREREKKETTRRKQTNNWIFACNSIDVFQDRKCQWWKLTWKAANQPTNTPTNQAAIFLRKKREEKSFFFSLFLNHVKNRSISSSKGFAFVHYQYSIEMDKMDALIDSYSLNLMFPCNKISHRKMAWPGSAWLCGRIYGNPMPWATGTRISPHQVEWLRWIPKTFLTNERSDAKVRNTTAKRELKLRFIMVCGGNLVVAVVVVDVVVLDSICKWLEPDYPSLSFMMGSRIFYMKKTSSRQSPISLPSIITIIIAIVKASQMLSST